MLTSIKQITYTVTSIILFILAVPHTTISPTDLAAATLTPPPVYGYTVINTYPHDPQAFTQGLVYEDGIFFEGTGLRNGRSSLRRVEIETGTVTQQINLADQYFGEGIVVWEERIIQLTWQANTGFVYDKTTFERLSEFTYPTEGWGITHDGERLIMSDGTATLYFWDPDTLAEIGRVSVYDENGPVVRLNELEYINGEVYANVWQTNEIVRINPETGAVVGVIDLTGILQLPEGYNLPVDVLNGIAYDSEADRLFVTGKLWPSLFEIELTQQATPTPIPPTATPAPTITPQPDLARGLVGDYPLNRVTDERLSVQGATLGDDRFGRPQQAYQFDGVDDYVSITATETLNFTNEFALTVWVQPQTVVTGEAPLMVKAGQYGLWLTSTGARLCVQTTQPSEQTCLQAESDISQQGWHHLVGQYDGNTLGLTHNGQPIGSRTDGLSGLATSTSPLTLGADLATSSYTQAAIDDLRLYNRPLSSAEIDLLYQQLRVYLPIIVK